MCYHVSHKEAHNTDRQTHTHADAHIQVNVYRQKSNAASVKSVLSTFIVEAYIATHVLNYSLLHVFFQSMARVGKFNFTHTQRTA